MKQISICILTVALWGASCWAQSSQPAKPASKPRNAPAARTNPLPSTPAPNITQLNSTLSALEQSTRQATLDLARLRIDKWKTDGSNRGQIEANVQSLMSNMANALPRMITAVRGNPMTNRDRRMTDAAICVRVVGCAGIGVGVRVRVYARSSGHASIISRIRRLAVAPIGARKRGRNERRPS